MNAKSKSKLPTWLPFVVGFLFVALFASLGAWQINRGLEKRAERQLFEDETGFFAKGRLTWTVDELRRANEILKRASAFFAAELDRPQK